MPSEHIIQSPLTMENVQFAKVQKEDIKMFLSVAGLALALQFGPPAQSLNENVPLAQEVQYRVPVKSPPCGHGWDVSARDGMCYPNGYLALRIRRRDNTSIVGIATTMPDHGVATTTTIEGSLRSRLIAHFRRCLIADSSTADGGRSCRRPQSCGKSTSSAAWQLRSDPRRPADRVWPSRGPYAPARPPLVAATTGSGRALAVRETSTRRTHRDGPKPVAGFLCCIAIHACD